MHEMAGIEDRQIYNTFNMGIGMVLAVDEGVAGKLIKYLGDKDEKAYIIGKIVVGDSGVDIC